MIRDMLLLNRLGTLQLKNKIKMNLAQRPVGVVFLVLLGVGFYLGFLWLSHRLLDFVYHQEVYGVLLANRLVEFLLYISVGMALLSSLTTAISHFYLSKDLEFQFGLPVRFDAWVLHRFTQVFFQSSWMVLLFGGAFIWIFLHLCQVPVLVQIAGVLVFAGLCSFPIMVSSFLCMVLVKVFPARRVHQVFLVLTVVLVSSVILIFRYLEPEKYIGPGGLERFRGLVDLIDTRRQPWNPAIWASNTLSAWGQQAYRESLPHFLKLLGLFSFLLTGLLATARLIYRRSWDRALQSLSGEGDLISGRTRLSWVSKHLGHRQWSQEIRELVLFLRDPSQWSQVFVLLALLGLYLFSITKVTDNLLGASKYTMALLNTIFVAFISLSISSRFVFTSFSADGQAIWLMKTAPDGWIKFMRGKLLVFGLPCLGFSLSLGLLSGVILNLDSQQLLILGLYGFWDSLFMVLMALGFGMFFINPTVENPLKLIVSPGGLLLMLVGVFFAALHLVLRLTEHMPVLNRALIPYGWPDLQNGFAFAYFAGLIVLEFLILVFLMRKGIQHLRNGDYSL